MVFRPDPQRLNNARIVAVPKPKAEVCHFAEAPCPWNLPAEDLGVAYS
ncbi:hypothetical protein [Candidatus Methylacidithermus pantelleriae]|nr:hypothetical protein [Candidatus Methylacidithermus pantelleriae]